MILSRDNNRRIVGGAVTDDANMTVEALRCDPITERLLIYVYPVTDTTPATLAESKIDADRINCATLTTDDANLNTSLLIVDSRNGYAFVDFIFE